MEFKKITLEMALDSKCYLEELKSKNKFDPHSLVARIFLFLFCDSPSELPPVGDHDLIWKFYVDSRKCEPCFNVNRSLNHVSTEARRIFTNLK